MAWSLSCHVSDMDFLRHFRFCIVKFNKHSLRTHCVPDGKPKAKDTLLNERDISHHHRAPV